VEVKYRSSNAQGSGFEYVAYQKQKQITFAARVWCQAYNWTGDSRLMAAAVSGPNCEDIQIVEL
jgi:Holliday junction resolvase-like predicted endonuclease